MCNANRDMSKKTEALIEVKGSAYLCKQKMFIICFFFSFKNMLILN